MQSLFPRPTVSRRWISFHTQASGIRAAILLITLLLCATSGTRAQQQPALTRIAFGSCAYQERPQPIWRAVLEYRPQLFLFAGDNVYGDVRNGKLVPEAQAIESLRHAYSEMKKHPEFVELRRTIPHLATWDDHDYGKDDAGGDFFAKKESQKLFLE